MDIKLISGETVTVSHKEPQEDWETINLVFDNETISRISKLEKILSLEGCTVSDLFIALLNKEINN